MDLPEDLEMNEDGEDEENQEENPFDIDKQKGKILVAEILVVNWCIL